MNTYLIYGPVYQIEFRRAWILNENLLVDLRLRDMIRVILSSMIKTEVPRQRCDSFLEKAILSASFSAGSFPRPIPAQEWTVLPPILRPAIPVDAVTAIESPYGLKILIISRKRTDFPVPVRMFEFIFEEDGRDLFYQQGQ